jgi:hypothetical protein
MKAFCLAAVAAIGLTLLTAPEPARSAQMLVSSAPHGEVSAVRKKARHKTYRHAGRRAYVTDSRSPYYLRPGVKPSFGYIGPPGYAGEYAWRKSIGQCVEDLGYGRWSACGWR